MASIIVVEGIHDEMRIKSVFKDANKNANYQGYDFKPMYTYIKEIQKKGFHYGKQVLSVI